MLIAVLKIVICKLLFCPYSVGKGRGKERKRQKEQAKDTGSSHRIHVHLEKQHQTLKKYKELQGNTQLQ